ncbi:disulfide bond formation protein B [Fontimonas sp. SYSU GA230001]|uniref:disulfide bond formation protein B n=1 Tax=Fontimonas sp. SYSU GA230001 TaxID=3142450 RepID=UPI0032B5A5C2
MNLSFRRLALLGFGACVMGLAFALYLQHFRGYEPCPMCIFQRIAMLAAGIVFLIAALHAPRRGGRWIYAILAALASAGGAAIAGRHVWLQSLPPDQVPACGPTLDYLLGMLPVMEVVTMVLKGDGNCAKIDAAWLGISLPAWTLIAFIGFVLYALAMPVVARIADRRSPFIGV